MRVGDRKKGDGTLYFVITILLCTCTYHSARPCQPCFVLALLSWLDPHNCCAITLE
jgi:hypothetical protein